MKEKCNHNPNKEDTTLIPFTIKKMTYPDEVFMFCNVCKETFTFIKNEDGKYIKNKK